MVSLLRMHLDASQPKAELAQLQMLNQRVAASIGASWSMVNKAFTASAVAIAALGGGFYAAYAANAEFNKSMTMTRALSDLSAEQIKEMTEQVGNLAIVYGESSNTIAEGLVILAKAGLAYEDIMTAMPTIVQLMKANATDFATAANIAIMTMNAFNKPYSDLAEVGDKVQKVMQATLLNIEDMQQSLQFAASTAQLAGVPFESLLAIMGTLANNAMRAGLGARSVSQMMLNMVEGVTEIQQWADSMNLGVQVIKDGVLNINELIPAFGKLGMSIDVLSKSNAIFTNNALRAWGVLIANADDYTKLLGEINNSQGELGRTTSIQITSLSTMMASMKEMIMKPLHETVITDELARVLNTLRETMKTLAPAIANLVFSLLKNFAQILPDLVRLVTSLMNSFHTGTPIIRTLANIIAGMNPYVLKLFILFSLIKRLDIVKMMFSMATATWGYNKALSGTISAEQAALVNAQMLVVTRQALITATIGAAFGITMLLTGYNKETRFMGALILAIGAATIAYYAMAAARAAAMPLQSPSQVAAWAAVRAIGVGAAVAAAAGTYAMLAPNSTPKTPTLPGFEGTTYPEFTDASSFQRGTRYVPQTQIAVVHKGEQIKSANKEGGKAGDIIINFNNSIVGEGAVKEIRRELGKLNRRDLGRLPS